MSDVDMDTLAVARPLASRPDVKHKSFIFGFVLLAVIVAIALAAPLLTPYDPYEQNLSQRLINPIWETGGTWAHALGTDQMGRDYLTRLLYGARISLLIGTVATLVAGSIGVTLGLIAGYFGGLAERFVVFLITIRLATPIMLVALALVALVGGSLQVIILILGFLLWDRFAVVALGSTKQASKMDYVAAAVAVGSSPLRIIVTEILPNIAPALIVVATLEIAQAIMIEAALSFLGLGVQPPTPSWGLMISEGKEYMFFSPWIITVPGLALFVLILAINLVGDGIRDIITPRR